MPKRERRTPRRYGKLIRRARKDGRGGGRSGKYDEWSLLDDYRLPYARMLDARLEQTLASLRAEAADAESRHFDRVARERDKAGAAAGHIAPTEDAIRRAGAFMDRALAQMDAVALREARVRDDLDQEASRRRRGETERPPDMPGDFASGTPATLIDPALGGDAARARAGSPEPAWEGPFGRQMPPWLKWALIALLVAIEFPVQWQIFHLMDPDWRVALPFAVSVAFVMGFLPHLAGVFYRARRAGGAERISGGLAMIVLIPWAALAVFFGDLRRRVLLAPVYGTDPREGDTPVPMLVDRLHLDWFTVSVMFGALLLLAGALAFLLGIADDHPLVAAYRGAARRQEALVKRLRQTRAAMEAAEARLGDMDERRAARHRAQEHREREARAAHDTAQAAYVDAVTTVLRKPNATQAAAQPRMRDDTPFRPRENTR
ncbi:hypothetical protein Skr01_15520 [Sphaerisporangium krabiense]|uniref:Uncharacterized protein n=1 Tax=Sphaerisporangium krabiense TaxID=763782 RepID=A0A7W9DMR7_9ACTN|nr:hypothetical protein [Sphaerisporangium krabiense]MBB5624578.1 hypothetical protein [Sphaerisporangium krabiense]GII61467.1 hypothetical protein Skr01_15520 [Sphaerisporangium krabiense]